MRSRVRERERLRAPAPTTDPAALATYASELRPVVAALRALAEEATARPSERKHTRAFLRAGMLKSIRALEARIDAIALPERGDTAGLGGSPAQYLTPTRSRRRPVRQRPLPLSSA